jgi:hypothetical protein
MIGRMIGALVVGDGVISYTGVGRLRFANYHEDRSAVW